MKLHRESRATRLLPLALVAFVALALRVGLAVEVRDHHALGYDATWYHVVANHLADGDGFSVDGTVLVGDVPLVPWQDARATALYPPLFPAVLSLASVVGADTFLGHQIFDALLGTATVVLIGLLGARVGGRRVGLVAAAIAAVHPLLIGADVAVMSESLYGLLTVAALLLAYRVIDSPDDMLRWIALGATCGAAGLTRNEGAAFALLLVIVTAFVARGTWARAVVALAVAALVMAPWIVRNAVAVDGTRGLSTNVGMTIAGGNCVSTYDGPHIGGWDDRCLHRQRWFASGKDEADLFNGLGDDGLDFARGHASRWPLVVAGRFGRVTSLFAPASEARLASSEGRHRPVELAGICLYYATLGGAIAGFALLRHRRQRIVLLLVPVIVVGAGAILHGNPRVRFAAEPVLAVASAVAVVATLDRLSGRLPSRVRPSVDA